MKTTFFIIFQFCFLDLIGQQINFKNLKGQWIVDSTFAEVDTLLVYGEAYSLNMDSILEAKTARLFQDCNLLDIRKKKLLICSSDGKITRFRLSIFDDALWLGYFDYVFTFYAKFLTPNDLLLSEWFPLGKGYMVVKRVSKKSI